MSSTASRQSAYPKGMLTFCLVIGFNMFSFVMINALLVLYLTESIHLSSKFAVTAVAAYMSLFYSSSLLGGHLGDYFDYKLAVIVGSLFSGIGYFGLQSHHLSAIYAALACFIIGNGLLIPNLQCIFGKLYSRHDPRRDSGFTMNYVCMNIGAFVAALSSGFIATKLGFRTAFLIGAFMPLFGLAIFLIGFKSAEFFHDAKHPLYKPKFSLANGVAMVVVSLIGALAILALLHHAHFSNILLLCLGVLMMLYIARLAFQYKGNERKRVLAFLIVTLLSLGFWVLYMLAPSALTLFVKHNVDRHVFGILIPAASLFSLNPLVILIFGPITSALFIYLGQRERDFSLPGKFSTAIILMGLGYLVLPVGIYFATGSGLTAFIWIVLSYLLQSIGELFIGPIALSMVGKLAPHGREGLLMGGYQLSTGVAGAISGFLASAAISSTGSTKAPVTNSHFAHSFAYYGMMSVGVGIISILMVPYVKKLVR